MKTGFICNSGFNLVASATVDGRQVIAVIFGAPNTTVRINLADALLTGALSRPKPGGKGFIGEIANQELGTLVPADLTAQVCRNKPEVTIADAAALGGWGISLGRYETAKDADKALRGRMIGARRLIAGGTSGVIRIPGTEGFHAMVWDLEQPVSLKVCAEFGKVKAYCDVMPPELLTRIVALAPKPREPAAVAEGSEAGEKAKPAAKSRKKQKAGKKRVRWKAKSR